MTIDALRFATMRRGLVSLVTFAATIACGGSDASAPSSAPASPGGGSQIAVGEVDAGGGDAQAPASDAASDGSTTQPRSLRDNRDRLLDSYAARKSLARCAAWSGLTATQKGVFLTITDLLGKRSFMSTTSTETALDHVTLVYALRDKGSFGNGGGDNNRIWIQVDAALAAALRDFDGALPEWGRSTDAAGPHSPFDATSETAFGQPRGQAHFWSADNKAQALTRPGVEGVNDPRVVEIDIDYNFIHDSNPEGTYVPGGYGRTYYESRWSSRGAGGGAELDYVPTGCP